MIVEGVGISVNGFYGKNSSGQDEVRRAMEQAVLDVLDLGINDPEERARRTREAVAEARAKAKALRREIDAAVDAAMNDVLRQNFASPAEQKKAMLDAVTSAAAEVRERHNSNH